MTFKEKVLKFVAKVPKGKVVSYGQVAAAAGSPKAARQVGGILRSIDILGGPQISIGNLGKGAKPRRPKRAKPILHAKAGGAIVPWWRVVNNRGLITIKGNWTATKELQKELLIREGVVVNKSFSLDIKKHRLR